MAPCEGEVWHPSGDSQVLVKKIVVPCRECNLKYTGQTGKSLEVRVNQHKDAVRLGHANNAVFKHVRDTNHAINWNSCRLVYKSGVESHRLTVESALIRKVPNFNNVQSTLGVDSLSCDLILRSQPNILANALR